MLNYKFLKKKLLTFYLLKKLNKNKLIKYYLYNKNIKKKLIFIKFFFKNYLNFNKICLITKKQKNNLNYFFLSKNIINSFLKFNKLNNFKLKIW